MILPKIKLVTFSNQCLEYSGLDKLEECFDKEHFLNYPYKVEYKYNSRGFRGPEWPSDLSNICWCIGDSFTAGLGSPFNHTWHYVLAEKANIQTINISMDGASNSWICRKTIDLLAIKPKNVVIQWSYIHRRETDNIHDLDEIRRIYSINTTTEQDMQHIIDCINKVELHKEQTNIIHTFIPASVPDSVKKQFDEIIRKMDINVVLFDQLDKARDGHHYDIQTSRSLAEKLIQSKYINI